MKKLHSFVLAALVAIALGVPAQAAPPMDTRVILDGYALSASLTPGAQTELALTLRNTHDKQSARNIVLTASNADGALLCVDRNTLYVTRLDAGKTARLTLALRAAASAAAGAHALALNMQYEDNAGTLHTVDVSVPVEVVAAAPETPRLRADTAAALPVEAADPVVVKLDAHNLGKSALYNLSATAQGAGLTLVRDAYAGNLDSGKSAQIELTMAFDKTIAESVKKSDAWKTAQPGDPAPTLQVPGQVTLSYEDAAGKKYSQTVRFLACANIPRPQEPAFAVAAAPQTTAVTQDPTGWAVAGVALVVAAAAVAISLWARRRRVAQ